MGAIMHAYVAILPKRVYSTVSALADLHPQGGKTCRIPVSRLLVVLSCWFWSVVLGSGRLRGPARPTKIDDFRVWGGWVFITF